MIEVYGQIPEYSGQGRPPTRKQPQPGWQYLQFIKHRDAHGRLTETELRVIFGNPEEVLALFGKSTAYVERTHLTMRLFNGRLVRHALGFSKNLAMYRIGLRPHGKTPCTTWCAHSKPCDWKSTIIVLPNA
jgi:hypothetical protein